LSFEEDETKWDLRKPFLKWPIFITLLFFQFYINQNLQIIVENAAKLLVGYTPIRVTTPA